MTEAKKEMLKKLGFGAEVEAYEKGNCTICRKEVTWDSFRDEISKKEFRISGMCQECQDKVFNGEM